MVKRYILFIVVSFLVFWLYAILFPPRPPVKEPLSEEAPEESTSPATVEVVKPSSGEAPQESTPPATVEVVKPSSETPPRTQEVKPAARFEKPEVTKEQRQNEKKVWLENDYCRMRLTKFGGAVGEVVLYTTRTNKKVVIHGKEPVSMPRRAVEETLNPLVITSSNGAGLDLSTHSFDLKEKTQRKAVYEVSLDTGLKVTKSFELAKDNYYLTMDVTFENLSEETIPVGKHQVKVGTVFGSDSRARYRDIEFRALGGGKVRKLSAKPLKINVTEEEIKAEYNENRSRYRDEKGEVKSFPDVRAEIEQALKAKKAEEEYKRRTLALPFLRWASAGNKYFALILSPEQAKRRYEIIPELSEKSSSKKPEDGWYSLGVAQEGFSLKPGGKIVRSYSLYAGPKEYDRLKRLKMNRKLSGDREYEKVMHFGWFGFVAVPLLKILKGCYKVVANYGLGIIFLTILIKVILYPLDQKSYKSMKEMQKLQPLIAELKKKYKDDPKRAQAEQMKLFKEHKVNPLGGCLPMLFQMPVLIAMFQMLRSAIELRGAPFVLWIKDLSKPDIVVDFHTELPFLGNLTLNILPLLLVVTFMFQTRISRLGSASGQQDPQQKIMGNMMTIVFGIIFYNMPSGLNLYFVISTILRLIQQYSVQKKG